MSLTGRSAATGSEWGRRAVLQGVVAGGLSAALAGCGTVPSQTLDDVSPLKATGPTVARPAMPVLNIGVLPITDCVPFYVAEQQGYFGAEGVEVALLSAASAAERDQLLSTGQADGGVSDLVAVALFNAQHARLRAVRKARQATSDSPQFWILVPADSDIGSVAELAGVEIAVSQNSVIQYVTERLLERSGVVAGQVKTVNVPQIPVRYQLLQQGQVRAATLPDPYASLALLEGARSIIADSSHPEISLSVLAFRGRVLDERPDAVRAFVAAYERAVVDIRRDGAAYQDLLIEKGRVPDPLRGLYTFPPLPPSEVPSEDQWSDVIDWVLAKGLIETTIDYGQAVDASFLP